MGTLTDIDAYWNLFIVPGISNFASDTSNQAGAFGCVVLLYHFWERVFEWKAEQVFGKYDPVNSEAPKSRFYSHLQIEWSADPHTKEMMQVLNHSANAIKHTRVVKGGRVLSSTDSALVIGGECYVDWGSKPKVIDVVNAAKAFWDANRKRYMNMPADEFKKIIGVP